MGTQDLTIVAIVVFAIVIVLGTHELIGLVRSLLK